MHEDDLKPAPSRVAPNGVTLSIFAKPPAAPVLQLFRQGEGLVRAVLCADDRAWLREQLAAFDPPPPARPLVSEEDMRQWAPSWRADQIDEFLTFGRCVALAQSKLQSPPSPTAAQLAVLRKLAAIADVYEASGLDEHRPEWGERNPAGVDLIIGRGGGPLLTLADAFAARRALR